MNSSKSNQREISVKNVSVAKLLKASALVVSMLAVGSFVSETISTTAQAQTQPGAQPAAKRKFGPGQNALPRGPRPIRRGPAQQRQPQKPVADVVAKEGKWIVQCDKPLPGAAAAKKPRTCGMLQTVVHKTNKRLGLTMVLTQVKKGKETGTMMRILAPIGVYLPTGVALEVDGSAAGRVPFSRCDPRFCVAFAQVRKETLAKMKKGKKGKFLIYEAPGVGIPLDLDLGGFSAALKALNKAQK